jgi:hypothetical protein
MQPKALKVLKSTGSPDTYYYVENRAGLGFDADIDGVVFHTGAGPNTSYLWDLDPVTSATDWILDVGQTYIDNAAGWAFTLLSKDATGASMKVSPCTEASPSISVSPAGQGGIAGESLQYTVTVTNNDSADCPAVLFSIVSTLPAGWSQSPSSPTLSLLPGASENVSVLVTAPSDAALGDYTFTETAKNNTVWPTLSSATSSAVYSVISDIPPVTSISSPADGSTVSGTITVSVSASDNFGVVTNVELWKDGVLFGTDTASPYSFSWDSRQDANGTHTLQSVAYNSYGNVGSSTIISVTSDNDFALPTVSITSPANGSTVKKHTTVTIAASASDNVGVTKVEFYVTNVLLCTDTDAPYTCAWSVPAPPNVQYQLLSKAYDAAEYVGTSAIVTVTSVK